eukprot:UN01229
MSNNIWFFTIAIISRCWFCSKFQYDHHVVMIVFFVLLSFTIKKHIAHNTAIHNIIATIIPAIAPLDKPSSESSVLLSSPVVVAPESVFPSF